MEFIFHIGGVFLTVSVSNNLKREAADEPIGRAISYCQSRPHVRAVLSVNSKGEI
jgi:hypothetical protein